jgi:hypothetical protein
LKKTLFSYLTCNQILAKSTVDHCHFGYNKSIANKNTAIDVYNFIICFWLENTESSPKQKINGTHGWMMGVTTFHNKIK